jgi:hypothetical protein
MHRSDDEDEEDEYDEEHEDEVSHYDGRDVIQGVTGTDVRQDERMDVTENAKTGVEEDADGEDAVSE